jgi:hypothetical protein
MRVALFVGVMAAHAVLLLIFVPSRLRERAVPSEELPPVRIFWPLEQPREVESAAGRPSSPGKPSSPVSRSSRFSRPALPAADRNVGGITVPSLDLGQQADRVAPPPDWRAAATLAAGHIVEQEETAQRQADALNARFKPLAPDSIRAPEFGWDYAATHRVMPAPSGIGLVISINDNCQLLIMPLPFIGCTLGKLPANGGLFKNMNR